MSVNITGSVAKQLSNPEKFENILEHVAKHVEIYLSIKAFR